MTDQLKLRWVMIFSTLFIVLNTFFIAREMYWFMVLPVALLVALIAFVALDVLLFIIVFLTPFSVILHQYELGTAISVPTEPLLFAVMIIYILRLFHEGKVERKLFFHPVTIAILINLTWVFLTCITSSIPIISWKFFLSRLWLVIPFYFVVLHLFKGNKGIGYKGIREEPYAHIPYTHIPPNMRRYLWLYMLSFAIVIIYTLIHHALDGFSEKTAHTAMNPFYNDHTSYGAMLAMYLPPLIFFAFEKKVPPPPEWGIGANSSPVFPPSADGGGRAFAFFLLLLFITGLIFSYTRAAWLSILCAAGTLVIYLLRIRLIPVLAMLGVLIALFFVYEKDIMLQLESGRHKNTKNRDIEQRLQSIANVTTDASNTERFNRWASAIRMFKEKPFFGWGPGTYQFQYAPYQISTEKTQISTNFGERGNAHSEYIGPLAETGLIGMLSVLGIVITTLLTAGKIIYHSQNKKTRLFAMAIALGLITYFVHGALNNFLDTDKAAAPFWGFIAMLVMMDVNEKSKD